MLEKGPHVIQRELQQHRGFQSHYVCCPLQSAGEVQVSLSSQKSAKSAMNGVLHTFSLLVLPRQAAARAHAARSR